MGTTTEKLTYLQGTKDAIKNAIVAKGVEVPEGTTFRAYAEKVGEIKSGGIEYVNLSYQGPPVGDRMFYYMDGTNEIQQVLTTRGDSKTVKAMKYSVLLYVSGIPTVTGEFKPILDNGLNEMGCWIEGDINIKYE